MKPLFPAIKMNLILKIVANVIYTLKKMITNLLVVI